MLLSLLFIKLINKTKIEDISLSFQPQCKSLHHMRSVSLCFGLGGIHGVVGMVHCRVATHIYAKKQTLKLWGPTRLNKQISRFLGPKHARLALWETSTTPRRLADTAVNDARLSSDHSTL